MAESKAFNEVRALLSKLDRSIDEARSKRVGPKEPERQISSENRPGSRAELDREIGAPKTPVPVSPLQAKRAQYGRARPLGAKEDQPQQARPNNHDTGWKTPHDYDDLTIG